MRLQRIMKRRALRRFILVAMGACTLLPIAAGHGFPGREMTGVPRAGSAAELAGPLFIIGGASKPREMLQRLLQLAGGETARIVVVSVPICLSEGT